jgi:dolichyl-phosphate beta-glucosyltransferase
MELAIVIPCFNEAKRFPVSEYLRFLEQHKSVFLLFVNDGSSDSTSSILSFLKNSYSNQVDVITLLKNQGKAIAVREGMLTFASQKSIPKIAFLDADLSTSLEECLKLSKEVNSKTHFVFGSRISKTDNRIERKWYRHKIGRIIATVISNMLGISVYDTQCGCKIVTTPLVSTLLDQPFISKWLFDVEIFFRLIHHYGKEQMVERTREIPLNQWIDVEKSKVKPSYMFRLWIDLYRINKRYGQ